MNKIILFSALIFVFFGFYTEGVAQEGITTTSSAKIVITSGSHLIVKGNVSNNGAGSVLTNNGTLTTDGAVQNATTATLQGNGSYKVGGNWSNSATFTAGTSTVELIGNNAATVASGNNSFYNLTLNKGTSNPIVSLATNPATVTNTLTFTGAGNKLQLGTLNLTVGSQIVNSNSAMFVITDGIGKLIASTVGATAFTFPIGVSASSYTPLSISQTGTALSLGARIQNQVLSNGTTGAALTSGVVNKSWIVTEENVPTTTKNLTLTMQWTGSPAEQLTGFNPSQCGISRWLSGSAWDLLSSGLGASTFVGGISFARSRSGITNVGTFAVGSSSAILPLTLLDFTAKSENNTVFLDWTTTAERNISHFDIEKSVDSKFFLKIARRDAINRVSTTSTPSVYQAVDDLFFTSSYYRLKINELDGTATYSKILYLEKNSDKNLKIIRDTEGSVFIETNDKIELITITNSIGQLIKSTKEKQFLINELNAGIYIVSVKTDKGYLSKKIFKE